MYEILFQNEEVRVIRWTTGKHNLLHWCSDCEVWVYPDHTVASSRKKQVL